MDPMRPADPTFGYQRSGALRRSKSNRVIGGVVGGLAAWLGVDPKLARIGWIILGLFGGGFVGYLVAWFVLPDEAEQRSSLPAVLLFLFVAVPLGCVACIWAIQLATLASGSALDPSY